MCVFNGGLAGDQVRRLEVGEVGQGQGIGVPEKDRTLQDHLKFPEIPGPAGCARRICHTSGVKVAWGAPRR